MKRFLLYACFVLQGASSFFAQDISGLRRKIILPDNDTILLDSLSLVPGSLKITERNSGKPLDTSLFKTDFIHSLLVFRTDTFPGTDSLFIIYRVFPVAFETPFFHKNRDLIRPDLSRSKDPFAYIPQKEAVDIFKTEGLTKNGSISRGISFGNNQDLAVNSNLNLQLSGKLTPEIDLLMVATDDNIPVQAEGNTRQLQEFDKVFIQLSGERSSLIAGHFLLSRPAGHFLQYNKKAQGLFASTLLPGKEKESFFKTSASIAVSRGKFARQEIRQVESRSGNLGIEGNQGPYRLRGSENEPFIIILSGTESVFMDGELLERGQDADYVIDYNTAEITFTPRRLITKDKRIIVEFQYSDKNYARSVITSTNEYSAKKLRLRLNAYSEQDSKNQPLQQDLNAEQKSILRNIGDSLENALYPGYDSVAFSGDEVLYRKTDTSVIMVLYKDVFVYSTKPDSAHYRVSFSYAGQGRGDYVQVQSAANGRVFRWVAPVAGVRQGSYIPQIILITPKKKQMLSLGAEYVPAAGTSAWAEAAVSNNDLNTFSTYNSADDAGYAVKLGFNKMFSLSHIADTGRNNNGWKLLAGADYELAGKTFSPVERFRTVEFERDWNWSGPGVSADQHIAGLTLGINRGSSLSTAYRFSSFLEGSFYKGIRHFLSNRIQSRGFLFLADGSYLSSSSPTGNTSFLRQNSLLSKQLKWIVAGIRSQAEQNRFLRDGSDTLLGNSFGFYEWEGFITNPDTAKNLYRLSYKQRTDFLPGIRSFSRLSFAEEAGAGIALKKNPRHSLALSGNYRRLEYADTSAIQALVNKPGSSITGRAEYNSAFLKGVIQSGTFYEIGTGLESKREFSYLEIAAGQGTYAWTDYNNNGIRELDEFEVARFPDQARYVRVYTPTRDYIKVYSNQFSQSLFLKPGVAWSGKTGIRKAVSLFADQASYRVERKTSDNRREVAYNPFVSEKRDSLLVMLNRSLRNTLYFNQAGSVFGLDFTIQDSRNRVLFINGFETRSDQYEEIRTRLNLSSEWSIFILGKKGQKKNISEYFSTRDYSIAYYEAEPRLNYQPSTSFRISALFNYREKFNDTRYGGQRSLFHDYGTELRYSIAGKGSFDVRADYIKVSYSDPENSPLSFEMLEGLKKGDNITWNLSWQHSLSNNLQLSFTYDGRKSGGNKAIHTGGAQVRAVF